MKEIIVYIGSNIPDKTPAGVRVFANALALKEYGYDVKIISKDIETVSDFDKNEGIDTWHLNRAKSTKEWIKTLLDVKAYTDIIDRIGNVKVVIAYELPAIAFSRLRCYCKNKGIKLICETAEWQKWENLGNLGFIARMVRLLDINASMYYAYKKADGLIVTSTYFCSHFKGCSPTLVLPTLQYYNLDIRNHETVNLVRKFIYAGGMGYGKDMLHEIIVAFDHVKERPFEFNILGLTKQQYIERFTCDEVIINNINKETDKIKFWGRVPHSAVLAEIRRSDFALIIRESSRRNNVGFPTKFGESINCGTPVIVSNFSDVVYYTKKYDVGIVTDLGNIAGGIQRAINMDGDSLQKMHQRCKECNAFHYKGHVNEVGSFVNSVLTYRQ